MSDHKARLTQLFEWADQKGGMIIVNDISVQIGTNPAHWIEMGCPLGHADRFFRVNIGGHTRGPWADSPDAAIEAHNHRLDMLADDLIFKKLDV